MTREKAVDLVMKLSGGSAEGLGADGAPGAGAGIQGATTARCNGRGWRQCSRRGVPGVGRPRRGRPTSGAPFLLSIDLP
jgi:hypothetical protein